MWYCFFSKVYNKVTSWQKRRRRRRRRRRKKKNKQDIFAFKTSIFKTSKFHTRAFSSIPIPIPILLRNISNWFVCLFVFSVVLWETKIGTSYKHHQLSPNYLPQCRPKHMITCMIMFIKNKKEKKKCLKKCTESVLVYHVYKNKKEKRNVWKRNHNKTKTNHKIVNLVTIITDSMIHTTVVRTRQGFLLFAQRPPLHQKKKRKKERKEKEGRKGKERKKGKGKERHKEAW